jgi:hypothetical protein
VSRPGDLDPYEHDPLRWGVSMAQHADLMLACLDAIGTRSVVEIGAYAGDLTRVLTSWAEGAEARVIAVDPAPRDELVALAEHSPVLELVRDTSLAALQRLPVPDALIIDGDHNYHTVGGELAAVEGRVGDRVWPLLLFHDVGWPHGRRDDYFDPTVIPPEARHPVVGDRGGIRPGDPGVVPDGLPYPRSAASEGGPRNGVLSAVEDFVAGHPDLRLLVVPGFFGFGLVWDRRAPWAPAIDELVATQPRQLLERLEANRLHHIAEEQALRVALWKLQERQARQEALLRRLLHSSAFALAERLSRLRVRIGIAGHEGPITKAELRRRLNEE